MLEPRRQSERPASSRRDELHESPSFRKLVRASWNSALRLGRLIGSRLASLAAVRTAPHRFQKYRVAPRLGTNAVRQRLLLGLNAHAPFTATETAVV